MTQPQEPEPDADDVRRLIERAAAGQREAFDELLPNFRGRLRRMVEFRLDPRLRGRVDPSDVVQDVFLAVPAALDDYLRESTLPFHLWLRLRTGDRIAKLHRHHLGAECRNAAREVSLFHGCLPEASSSALAAHLMGAAPPPDEAAARAERIAQLHAALDQLDPTDREVLVLRHFEQLTSREAAVTLGISTAAAAKRYFRAVVRLRDLLAATPGGFDGFAPV